MEKSFLEELKKEIEKSTYKWNIRNTDSITTYSNINNMRRQILSTEYKFMRKDESGKFDPNNIRIVTQEEKEMLLNMMEEKKYPLTGRMFSFLLKSYINGKLELTTEKPGRKL